MVNLKCASVRTVAHTGIHITPHNAANLAFPVQPYYIGIPTFNASRSTKNCFTGKRHLYVTRRAIVFILRVRYSMYASRYIVFTRRAIVFKRTRRAIVFTRRATAVY